MVTRVCCYFDGFNLYHAIDELGRPHLKWVDLSALARTMLRPGESLACVRYFSAYATWLPGPYARHRQYVAALEATGTTPVMAHFKDKYRSCRRCGHSWKAHEEKETDVRLALAVLEDGYDDLYDRAVIVSADSDLVPAIEKARRRFVDKKYYVAAPPGQFSSARGLMRTCHGHFEISPARIGQCLLPERIVDDGGAVVATRPREYAPPTPR
jgi:NYN domain